MEPLSDFHVDDRSLFRAAMGDVKPIKDNRRVEIERPKPAPLPRTRTVEAASADPAAEVTQGHAGAALLSDAALLRAMMDGVVPLKENDRAQIGQRRTRATRAPTPGNLPARPGDAVLLPAEPDKLSPDDLFRYANAGTRLIENRNRVELRKAPPSTNPIKRCEDERAALRETMDAPLTLEDRLETGDEVAFLRPGLPRRILTDLRRGRWVLQGELDLHGLNRDQARSALVDFLAASVQWGRRCIRVIHGKGRGSPGGQSILKHLSRHWLAQREEILAFCQAAPNQGGSGALMVLLRGPKPGASQAPRSAPGSASGGRP